MFLTGRISVSVSPFEGVCVELRDLKVIVTGGAQGMGAHFARRLAEAGAPSPPAT